MASVSCVGWRPKLAGSLETTNVVGDLGSLLKDKKSTWQKSCKESLNREHEVLVLADELKAQGSVSQNLSRAQAYQEDQKRRRGGGRTVRKKQQEDEMWKELEEYIASWDTEATSKAKELCWSEGENNPKCWLERAMTLIREESRVKGRARRKGCV